MLPQLAARLEQAFEAERETWWTLGRALGGEPGAEFAQMDVVDLASVPASELLNRTAIDPKEIDASIFGVVVPALYAPNLGREVLLLNEPPDRAAGHEDEASS